MGTFQVEKCQLVLASTQWHSVVGSSLYFRAFVGPMASGAMVDALMFDWSATVLSGLTALAVSPRTTHLTSQSTARDYLLSNLLCLFIKY